MLEYFLGLIQGLLTAGLIIYFEKHYAEPKEDRTFGAARSPQWPKVRAEHLKKFPNCALCGSSKDLNVHHVIPVHVDKSKELLFDNLITLCDNESKGCHIRFGHLFSYFSWNVAIKEDAKNWGEKIKNRP